MNGYCDDYVMVVNGDAPFVKLALVGHSHLCVAYFVFGGSNVNAVFCTFRGHVSLINVVGVVGSVMQLREELTRALLEAKESNVNDERQGMESSSLESFDELVKEMTSRRPDIKEFAFKTKAMVSERENARTESCFFQSFFQKMCVCVGLLICFISLCLASCFYGSIDFLRKNHEMVS